jgi:hypothetical protein
MYSTPRVALFDNHMDMATPSTAVRPLLDYRPACRILVIADTRRPAPPPSICSPKPHSDGWRPDGCGTLK